MTCLECDGFNSPWSRAPSFLPSLAPWETQQQKQQFGSCSALKTDMDQPALHPNLLVSWEEFQGGEVFDTGCKCLESVNLLNLHNTCCAETCFCIRVSDVTMHDPRERETAADSLSDTHRLPQRELNIYQLFSWTLLAALQCLLLPALSQWWMHVWTYECIKIIMSMKILGHPGTVATFLDVASALTLQYAHISHMY